MTSFELAILSNVFVATCIAACAFCIGLRNCHSAAAHVLWIVVFLKLVAPPLYTIPLPVPPQWYDGLVAGSHSSPVYSDPAQKSFPSASNHFGRLRSSHESRLNGASLPPTHFMIGGLHGPAPVSWAFFALWLIVALSLLVKGAVRFVRFSRLLYEKGEHSEEGCCYLLQLLTDKGRSRAPKVLLVPIDMAPMLFGIGNSTSIVCPQRLWNALSSERRKAFLAHEAAHYLRRDHWVRWLEWIVSSLYWWLPLTYFARRQLERSEEISCDQWVVNQLHTKRREYAETLFQVAEFLDDARIASPRLASRMQSTDLLEKRVESILRSPEPKLGFHRGPCFSFALVSLSLLAHPYPYRHHLALERDTARWPSQVSIPTHTSEPTVALIDGHSQTQELNLPNAPAGWWNATPERQWADLLLPSSGGRLVATAGAGLRLQVVDGRRLDFPADQLSACVEIPNTNRMVIADTTGALRLWDMSDGTAISLIGNHAAGISSVAFHETMGLVASDAQGSVIRWDHRSGRPLQTWTTQTEPVQTIRWSQSGKRLAVLLGSWSRATVERQLVVLDANQFEESGRLAVPHETAVVWEDTTLGWLYVDWHGHIHTLSGDLVSRINKQNVSARVLSQNAIVRIDDTMNAFEESSK